MGSPFQRDLIAHLIEHFIENGWNSIKYELDGSPFFQRTGKMDSHLMALRAATDNMLREALVERNYNMLVNFPGLRVR
jgi:hypothetical protein